MGDTVDDRERVESQDLLGRKFGHHINFWSMSERKLTQRVDLGDEHQMVLELRPAHDPPKTYGFVGVVISVEDLSASVWLWHQRRPVGGREGDHHSRRTRRRRRPAAGAKPFGAVPPLVSDIDLSVDDRWLYVSCWGTGELNSMTSATRSTRKRRIGSPRRNRAAPATPGRPGSTLRGGPQMVEISRDGRRVYVTNSLYAAWDEVFYPDGVGAWMAKLDADISAGGLVADTGFFPHGNDFRGLRVHQTRLAGGDASSDSYCFTN